MIKKLLYLLMIFIFFRGAIGGDSEVLLNLNGVKIEKLLEYVAKRLNKTLIYEKGILSSKEVTLISPEGVKVPEDALLDVINTIIEFKGYSIVSEPHIIRVVPINMVKQQPLEVLSPQENISHDTVVTKIVKVKYIELNTARGILNNIKSREGIINTVNEAGILVITDYKNKVDRMVKVLKYIDNPTESMHPRVFQLEYAKAAEVARMLNVYNQSLFITPRQRRFAPRCVADSRTNSVVVYARERDMERIEKFIKKVDVKTPEGKRGIHVYKVKNGDAEDISKVLEGLYAQRKKDQKNYVAPSIVADKSTNSIIIICEPEVFDELENILKQIDTLRPQVLIETLIVELTMEKAREFGIEVASVDQPGDHGSAFVATSLGLSAPSGEGTGKVPVPSEGLIGGIWKDATTKIPLLIKASEQDSDVNVLAIPKLMTNDNEEATIEIMDKIPYDQVNLNSSGDITSTTFGGYQDAGIKLKIRPHISEEDYLRLEIEQNIDAFVPSAYSQERPAVTSRSAKTIVTVPDETTIVLGGLTRTDKRKRLSKVPILGDIPVLGWLFKYKRDTTQKVNLYIFITPHIIRELEDTEIQTNRFRLELDRARKTFESDSQKEATND